MKPLQNPWVVGGLAVLALALVFRNALWPLLRRARMPELEPAAVALATSMPPPSAVAPEMNPPLAKSPAADESTTAERLVQSNLALITDIAVPMLQTSVVRWAEAPRRDPFQVRLLAKIGPTTNQVPSNLAAYPPAAQLLTLSAIWRQTGSKLAVINQKLIGEGETLLKFKIENIEADRVWVSGPNGREEVEFKLAGSAVTNMNTLGTHDSR